MADRAVKLTQEYYNPKFLGLDDLGSSLITLDLDLGVYRKNLRVIREHVSPSRVFVVLKADAYGFGISGLVPVLNEFEDVSTAVATADEALELRGLGYRGRILLMGYTHPKNYYQIIHSGCELCAYRPEQVDRLAEVCAELEHGLMLHIKVNTGMNRLGVSLKELPDFIAKINDYPQLSVQGLFSHMANGGEPGEDSNIMQANRFREAINIAIDGLKYRPECHLANSGTVINFPDLYFDAVRVGALQFGFHPPGELPDDIQIPVEPCYKLSSEIIDIHRVEPGEGVGYSFSYVAERETTIVTVPFGYADGMFRVLSNEAEVLIHGKRFPQVGNVAMDYVMIDVGDEDVEVGDEVVFVGGQDDEYISLNEVADKAEALPYQLTCSWRRRVRRVYHEI